MFDILKSEQEKAYNFIQKNHENGSFSHAYIVEAKNYNNLDLFLQYFVSNLLNEDSVDINKFFKKGRSNYYQARIFYIFLVMMMSYLIVNFMNDFLGVF